jgi:hypothetical protein
MLPRTSSMSPPAALENLHNAYMGGERELEVGIDVASRICDASLEFLDLGLNF